MATRVRTRRWTDMRRESAMLIADIKNNEPTVLLVDNFSDNWSKWLADNPDVAGRVREYCPGRNLQDNVIWKKTAAAGVRPAPGQCCQFRKYCPNKSLPKPWRLYLLSKPN